MAAISNQIFRVIRAAIVWLLAVIAIVLFALQLLHHKNNKQAQLESDAPALTAEQNAQPIGVLFATLSESQNLSAGEQRAGTPSVHNSNEQGDSHGNAVIKQRSHSEQVDSRFRKIDFNGAPLGDDAAQWSCARDLDTGLLWEVKLFNAGVSDAEHTYSWYDPDGNHPGKANGGTCFGTDCDTRSYIEEMNNLALCGTDNWRIPSFEELDGLIDRNYYNPTINQEVFPHARGAVYWTATELGNNPEMVMQIDFFNGMSTAVRKDLSFALRLVSP